LSQAYDSQHPEINIHLENIPKTNAYSVYKNASQLGEAADIMLLDNAWVNEFAALSYLTEVNEILVSDMQALQIAPMVSQVKWNGYIWAVPKDIDPYILAWNKPVLEEMEIIMPPGTSEDFLNTHQALRGSELGYGVYFDFNDPYAFITLVWALGREWLEEQTGNTIINREETVNALETFFQRPAADAESDEQTTPAAAPYPIVLGEGLPWELLNNGSLPMMITSYSAFKDNAAEGIHMAALPYMTGLNDDTVNGGWLAGSSFAVSSKSALSEEAFEWIQSITTTDAQLTLMEAGGALPVMLPAYESEQLLNNPYYEVITDALEQGEFLPPTPYLPDKLMILQDGLNKLRLEEQNVQEFTSQIEQQWKELTQ
jgi:ABC-type glycerol-3-phosphate transport system substrate-binding protein